MSDADTPEPNDADASEVGDTVTTGSIEATGKQVEPAEGIRMADLPRLDRRVHDLISDHSDIVDLADDFYKPTPKVARSMGYDIKSADLL